jgi:hypothetical protein
MEKIFERILDTLKGADFWIALGFLAVGYICWRVIGAKTSEQKVLWRQIGVALVIALLAGGAIWANHFFFQREPVFSKNLTGILVMRIVGDDVLDSLRADLVEKRNAELQKEGQGQPIEVHAGREVLDENRVSPLRMNARAPSANGSTQNSSSGEGKSVRENFILV